MPLIPDAPPRVVFRLPAVRLATAILVAAYVAAVLLRIVEFELWRQILIHPRVGVFDLNFLGHSHALRYMLVLPVLTVADLTGLDQDYAFSIAIMLVVLGTGELVYRARGAICRSQTAWPGGRLALLAFFIALSFFQNGRMVLGLFGMTLLLWAATAWWAGRLGAGRTFLGFLLALLFSSVSSGGFSVALATIVAWSLFLGVRRLPRVGRREALLVGAMVVVAFGAMPFLQVYMRKAVTFYGGGLDGFVNMLNHGPGTVLYEAGPVIVPLLAALAVAGVLCLSYVILRAPALSPPLFGTAAALALGGFGYSTLAMGLPALVLLVAVVMTPYRAPQPAGAHAWRQVPA